MYTRKQTNNLPLCKLCSFIHFWSKHLVTRPYPLYIYSHKAACTHATLQTRIHCLHLHCVYIVIRMNKLLRCLQFLHVNYSSNSESFLSGERHKQNWMCFPGKPWNCPNMWNAGETKLHLSELEQNNHVGHVHCNIATVKEVLEL